MGDNGPEPLSRAGKKVILQGNEACARAAIHGGCRFFAGYPITPSTEVIEILSAEMVKAGGTFIQMEDEIASACAIVGARWGGKRAMTATSGPGFTLMQETVGYAAVTETPIVIVNVQRGGPSTGQPTLPSQQDIYQAKYGSHGDYEIIALTPSSVQEMYDFTILAFEMAEKYRTPVILLTDEIVGHMREKITIFDTDRPMRSGHRPCVVSPQEDFYTGGNSLVEGQLHDENGMRIGHIASESGDFIRSITGKILNNIDDIAMLDSYFMEDADVCFLCYGPVSRSALNAVKTSRGLKVKEEGRKDKSNFFKRIFSRKKAISKPYHHLKIGLIKVNTVWPFPEQQIKYLGENCKYVFVPEMNQGKYYREIERCLKNSKVVSLPKIGGEIHSPQELLQAVEKEMGISEQIDGTLS